MEFWGVEVKPNESLKVEVEDFKLLHISQVALGEVKNGKNVENVPVRVNINDKKYVVGTLSSERAPQIMFDLVFEQDLELSHGWKEGSIYFCGYIADNPVEDDDYNFDSSSDEEEALNFNPNGALQGKPKADLKDAKEDVKEDDSDSDEDEDEDEDDDSEETGSDEEDDLGKEKEKAKPLKRPAEAPIKTPIPAKKAKANTPQKTDGKKGGHIATPHPASKPNFKKGKKAGK